MEPELSGRRRDVVALLRSAARALSAREVADELGLHINTARFHLDALLERGVVQVADSPTNGPGRPPLRYSLAPGMDRGGRRNYELLAEMLLSHLAADADPTAAALRAGETWGHYLVQQPRPSQRSSADDGMDRLTKLLDDIGFESRVPASASEDSTRIELQHCPFLELAEERRELVCGMHLGLMRGALAELRAPLRARSLTPFADPQTCVAVIAPAQTRKKG